MLSFPLLPDLLPLSVQPQEGRQAGRLRTSKDLVLQQNQQRLMRLEWLTSSNTAVAPLTVDPGVALSVFTWAASHNKSQPGKLQRLKS